MEFANAALRTFGFLAAPEYLTWPARGKKSRVGGELRRRVDQNRLSTPLPKG